MECWRGGEFCDWAGVGGYEILVEQGDMTGRRDRRNEMLAGHGIRDKLAE